MKRLFMIRHCNAEGQHKDSPLTRDGVRQSKLIADFFEKNSYKLDRIISSPFLRAIESIKPYAQINHLPIDIDERLQERMLSVQPVDDWMDVLEESFNNLDFKLPGGESSNDARSRSLELINEVMADNNCENVAIVTHGNLLAILLKEFQADIGFTHWKGFTNPDIFLVQKVGGESIVERIWKT
ncbi:histidine phosphatase family protein [Sediminibacillus massiliensis]|uniref:histidine phosphatase family protein n=1 Tax=Sediminibacillus massiliensis TaxID=1926277 RepID=UPI000988719C|nr:histidine phosphatase family protein [Sediminibacillus massiliensis]